MIRDREKRVIIEQQGRDVKDFAMLSILTRPLNVMSLPSLTQVTTLLEDSRR